jgi:threonine dehydrogenase-like Zn-dependent dehydrogenase
MGQRCHVVRFTASSPATGRGGPEQLFFEDAPLPELRRGDVLLRVHATGITPAELTWDQTYQNPDGTPRIPGIPGHEVSGVVERTAPDVTDYQPGDEVNQIPRGSVTLMLKTILYDKREALYKNLAELCETPAGALKFAELAGDRIEGKPTQRLEHRAPRHTIFQREPNAPARRSDHAALVTPAPVTDVFVGENGETFVPVRADL